jgi:phosphoribosylformimino-5-aminoimidazole carboxamide ribotide isomerase
MRFLLVIPSIDIKHGKTVRVVQGIPELDCTEYGSDPVEMAKIWRAENAKMLHVVDFDGAHDHSNQNFKIVEQICSSVVIPVEFAGGIRDLDDAKAIMDTGICRLALGTMPISNPEEFKKVFDYYGPTKIVLSLDIIDDELVIKGRRIKTGINCKDFVTKMAGMGIERFIVTDVLRNGVLNGPNLQLSTDIARISGQKVTHSGGIRNKDELMDIQRLIPAGIDSVIVGRALYENKFPCQKLWRVAELGIFN